MVFNFIFIHNNNFIIFNIDSWKYIWSIDCNVNINMELKTYSTQKYGESNV
jgi:hypothetical protein